MDVEAQEDGVLARITQQDGTKAVKVGSRIAIMAEQGDDLSSLEVPAEDPPSTSPAAVTSAPDSKPQTAQQQPTSEPQQKKTPSPPPSEAQTQNKKYPLYPSVAALLHQHNLSASSIPASGPAGRLLKGDVLSHLGRIDPSYSSRQSSRISKLAHLDLSNIQVSAPAEPQPTKQPDSKTPKQLTPTTEEDEAEKEVAVPVSLHAALATQRHVRNALGILLPLSTFITRASDIANRDLPAVAARAPTADELFDAVLGLDKAAPRVRGRSDTSRGRYIPRVAALPPPVSRSRDVKRDEDIIDILTGASQQARGKAATPPTVAAADGELSREGPNVFSLSVRSGEERRARTYLERVKSVLEAEPGRCVL